MNKEWECKKCGFSHEWEVDFPGNWFKCKNCKAIRCPWMVWALGGLVTLLLVVGVWKLIPGDDSKRDDSNKEAKEATEDLKKQVELPGKIAHQVEAASEIVRLLSQGEFLQAKTLIPNIHDEHKRRRLLMEMETSLNIEVAFQYQKEVQKPSPFYPLDSLELNKLTLTNRDNYRLNISASHSNVYFYIFQQDFYHQIKRLFPDPVWSQVDNPIQSDMVYQVPPGERQWFYLDELPSSQDGPIAETIYVIASPWKAEDIERLYGKIHETTDQQIREKLIKEFIQRLRLRDEGVLNSLCYKELSFNHGK